MARATAWFAGNDMVVRLAGLRSSTMSSGTYLTNSGGVTADLWSATSTETLANLLGTYAMTYTGSSGRYEVIVHSTDHSMATSVRGMAIIRVDHGAMNGEWRPHFRVEERRST